jgi:serine/threonine-protein kinase
MGPQPQEYVIEWGIQLCDVFEYLHNRKPAIIYRDLKPGNIMLRPDGRICLIDFGTAREYKADHRGDTQYLGTRGYAAPEQFGGQGQTDARTDVYCLGATMYNLLTGHTSNEPPYEFYPIRYWNPNLSAGLEHIIQKCVQNDPKDRYQSCAEVMYDLQHYKELDRDYKKTARLSVGLFGLLTAGAIACGVLSFNFYNSAKALATESYDSLLLDALDENDDLAAMKKYAAAIQIDPTDARAFEEVLEERILADDVFTTTEDETLRALLITGCDGTTIEKKLAENPEAYDEFVYKLGLAYYYCYEESGNKQKSLKWLKMAAESKTLSEQQKDRATRLKKIAEYYDVIGTSNSFGDKTIRFNEYWADLVAVAEGNIAEADNATTALMVYKEIAGQVYAYPQKFMADNVSYDEITRELNLIRLHIEEDIESQGDQGERINSMVEEVKELLDQAQEALELQNRKGG